MQHDETIRHEIENMLRQKIGLNPESVGTRSILRAVKKGMRTGKMQGLSDYWAGLKRSPETFTSLVEAVVVPETSFFRNRASFVYLRQWVAREWAATRPLRVLSLPCSTGEEPYSIVITLLEEGLSFDQFHIDAVDISQRALEKAKEGIYSPYAFRRQTYRSDDKYFKLGVPPGVSQNKRLTQRYFLTESVREKVSFSQGNVLDSKLLNDVPPYDLIFCRNLLIYFDREARERTFRKLNQLLRPDGLLFLGYAETSMIDTHYYQPVPYPQTFAYRKQTTKRVPQPTLERAEPGPTAAVAHAGLGLPSQATEPVADAKPRSSATGSIAKPGAVQPSLERALQLANKGEHDQAAIECDRYLSSNHANPAAHLLRGELYQTAGNDSAAEACFEKAAYLDPQLSEALVQLMLSKEAKKDVAGAALIRERLQRLE